MRWTNGVDTNHQIDLNLNLILEKILPSKDLSLRLHTQSEQVRKEIANLVLGQILPKIIQNTGLEYQTSSDLNVKTNIENNSQASVGIPTLPSTMLMIKNRIHLVLDLKADKPVNAMQALYRNRAAVAIEIANQVMKFLYQAVLNIDEERSSADFSIDGNQFTKLNHKIKKSSADLN
jgi:hypothetical protein